MPTYTIQGPSGKTYTVEGPDGADADQLGQFILSQSKDERIALQTQQDRAQYDPTKGMSTTERVVTGIGQGMSKIGRAVGQAIPLRTGKLVSDDQIAEANQLDAPLTNTTAGKVGSVLGQTAVIAPVALIPGANTYAGATAIGAGTGALTTEGGLEERAKGALYGGIGGAAGKGAGDLIGAGVQRFAQARADRIAATAGKATAANAARDAGYVLPPTEFNPSALNSALEGLSGKVKTAQAASTKNQATTNTLARRAVGAPEDQALTKETLAAIRSDAGKAYDQLSKVGSFNADEAFTQQLAKLKAPLETFEKQFPQLANKEVAGVFEALNQPSFESGAVVEALKRLRFDGNANRIAMDPAKKELGRVQTEAAKALEGLVDRNLTAQGLPQLLKQFQEARTLIAKSHTVEKALNEATGDVSATALAAAMKRGKPLSGDLRTIAETATAFPKATQSLPQSYNAVSPLDYLAGGLGSAATGNPLAMAGVAARPAVRSLILSKGFQNRQSPEASRLADLLIEGQKRGALQGGARLGSLFGSLEAAKQ